MASQRKNFRCPREELQSPSAKNSACHGFPSSYTEFPVRQRKRVQVGSTNLSRSISTPDVAMRDNLNLSLAANRICGTNIDLMKASMSENVSKYELPTDTKSPNERLESLHLRPISSHAVSSSNQNTALRGRRPNTSSNSMDTIHKDESDGPEQPRFNSKALAQRNRDAVFQSNRQKLYEAFVDKYGSVRAVFKAFDSDSNGMISYQRFQDMVEASEVSLSPEETQYMYRCVDINGDNTVEFQEFAQMFTASEYNQEASAYNPATGTALTADPSSSIALKFRTPLDLSPRSRQRMKELRTKVTDELTNKHSLEVNMYGGKNELLLMQAFKYVDTDNDGLLSYQQVRNALGKEYLQLSMDPREMDEMICLIDRNADQQISMREFVQYFGAGKGEPPTDLLDNGRKKALAALHMKKTATLTPREEFDPNHFRRQVAIETPPEEPSDKVNTGCMPQSLSRRTASHKMFQARSSSSRSQCMTTSLSLPVFDARNVDATIETGLGPAVTPLAPVSQDRFLHRRILKTDWTRVGVGGDGMSPDTALYIPELDRFATTNNEVYSPMLRGQNSGDVFRLTPSTASAEFGSRQRVREARYERTQQHCEQMAANRQLEVRIKDWKMRANIRKCAGQQFAYLDRIHDKEHRAALRDLHMSKRHGGASFLRMWAGSADSQFSHSVAPTYLGSPGASQHPE